jgi:hypothetical protein
LAAGLTLGAAMRPDLAADDRPAGPQILEGWSGARSAGPFDDNADVSVANYHGKLPDYVLGTDAKRVQAWSWAEPAPRQVGRRSDAEDDLPPAATEQLASAAIGGDAYDAVVAEKTPAAWPADIEDEAPPEASGDTRAAN